MSGGPDAGGPDDAGPDDAGPDDAGDESRATKAANPVSTEVTICNRRGLHARAAAKFVKLAQTFDAEIKVFKDGMEVCGTSIMGLLLLGAAPGDTIRLTASGAKAQQAVQALVRLVQDGFDEGG
ncbi:MAG: HPr family phosphocarrier protein [Proteobacteria bacterium]|nr:HPr family phosphocarrier protein [Pseudomonadota bacterium]